MINRRNMPSSAFSAARRIRRAKFAELRFYDRIGVLGKPTGTACGRQPELCGRTPRARHLSVPARSSTSGSSQRKIMDSLCITFCCRWNSPAQLLRLLPRSPGHAEFSRHLILVQKRKIYRLCFFLASVNLSGPITLPKLRWSAKRQAKRIDAPGRREAWHSERVRSVARPALGKGNCSDHDRDIAGPMLTNSAVT